MSYIIKKDDYILKQVSHFRKKPRLTLSGEYLIAMKYWWKII